MATEALAASCGDALHLKPLSTFRTLILAWTVVAFSTFFWSRSRKRVHERIVEKSLSYQHGCKKVQWVIAGKLPLALDLVKDMVFANAVQRLLLFFHPFIDRFGPTLELRLLGNVGIVTTDPENIKAILTKKSNPEQYDELDWGYGQRRHALMPLFGDGIFTQDGPAWKQSRETLRKNFARMHYQNLDNFAEHVELLVERLSNFPTKQTVDLQTFFFNFTLDTSTSLLFGESAGSLREGDKDELGKTLNSASWASALRVQLAYLYWIYNPPNYLWQCHKVRQYTDKWVKRALDCQSTSEGTQGRYELIRSLYAELQDRRRLREQLVNVLLAGRDTTASLLSWTFRLLVRYPTTLKRLQAEVQRVLGQSTKVTKATLQKMPYLKAVVSESLRLYPPVPINLREAKWATVLPTGGGKDGSAPLLVPKQQGIGYSPYFMHRRKDLYGDDALEFKPERWEDGKLLERIGWGYLPFNAGPRVCLGQEFALLEASYAIARVVQAFPGLSLPPEEIVEPIGHEAHNMGLTMAPADGCRVRLSQ